MSYSVDNIFFYFTSTSLSVELQMTFKYYPMAIKWFYQWTMQLCTWYSRGVISHSQITKKKKKGFGISPSWQTKLSHGPPPPHLLETTSESTHVEPNCNVRKGQWKLLKSWFCVRLFLSYCKHLIIHTMEQMGHSL